MQTMLLPKAVIKEIERNSKDFLWGDEEQQKKIHLAPWELVAKNKELGGLGIKDLAKQNKAFIMKLCWNMVNNREALWVKVLRAKYKCGEETSLRVKKYKNASLTWRGICEIWEKAKEGIRFQIGNGQNTNFWRDNWSELNIPLINLVQGYEQFVDQHEKVIDYVTPRGEWDRDKLGRWFNQNIIEHIIRVYPPCEERGEDKILWLPSTNGCFSVKSAYNFLCTGTQRNEDNLWKKLWKWRIPEKIKSFMWLFAHDRIHTASLRLRRGLNEEARCPFSCDQQEDNMHVLRDCYNAKDKWKSVVNPSHWRVFFDLRGQDWLKWNLANEAGQGFTKKIQWPTLFAYICWDIWVERCNKLFRGEIDSNFDSAQCSFYRACWDQDILKQFSYDNLYLQQEQGNIDIPAEFVRLETDASVLPSRKSGCGGAIRGSQAEWLGGFICKLIVVPITIAEILGIIYGLQICRTRGYRKIQVVTDSTKAINLITRGCVQNHPFKDIIDEARSLTHGDWHIVFHHVPRECISIADKLAKLAHNIVGSFCTLDQPPSPH